MAGNGSVSRDAMWRHRLPQQHHRGIACNNAAASAAAWRRSWRIISEITAAAYLLDGVVQRQMQRRA